MFKPQFICLSIVFFIILSGCDLVKTEKDEVLFKTASDVHNQIEQQEWDKALTTIKEFENLYEDRKWKLQLLGELEDYKELELEIVTLKESLKEEDRFEAKVGLRQIEHRLHLIYEL